MPNPIAHPTASILFVKVGLVFSALVIGSISPDFGYFIRLPTPLFSHTALGLILFDVPVGFVLLWLFQALAKWPLLSLLPRNWQRRLFMYAQGFSFGPLKRFGLILLSLFVGALTHVIWDSFTHDYGWIVQDVAFFHISINGTPLYAILQDLSTIIGIGTLIYWFIKWLPTASQGDQLPARFSIKVQAIFFALTAISIAAVEGTIIYSRLMNASHYFRPHFLPHFLMGSISISAFFIICFFVGIYCLTWIITFHKTIRCTSREI